MRRALLLAVALAGCGVKAPPRPPERAGKSPAPEPSGVATTSSISSPLTPTLSPCEGEAGRAKSP